MSKYSGTTIASTMTEPQSLRAESFSLALPQFANKRLTYAELTGKTENATKQRQSLFNPRRLQRGRKRKVS